MANDWISKNPFSNYKSKLKEVIREYLSPEEIEMMMNKKFVSNRLEIIKWLEQKGKQTYGDNFNISEVDLPIITALLVYFLNDEITAKTLGIDLNKGILLSG